MSSRRGLLHTKGHKEFDKIEQEPGLVVTKVDMTQDGMILSAQVPELQSGEIDISVDGEYLRVEGHPGLRGAAWANLIQVPPGYDASEAQAIFFAGNLRIVIPKE